MNAAAMIEPARTPPTTVVAATEMLLLPEAVDPSLTVSFKVTSFPAVPTVLAFPMSAAVLPVLPTPDLTYFILISYGLPFGEAFAPVLGSVTLTF